MNEIKELEAKIGFYLDRINEDMKDTIFKGLLYKKKKFGEFYCPCKLELSNKNICPCVEFRAAGDCHCNLFKKI
jgi:ferredoxin-thioredoxin reductase catalytic subunit